MFNEFTFGEVFLLSLGNINDYMVRTCSKYPDVNGSNKTREPGWEEVEQCDLLS